MFRQDLTALDLLQGSFLDGRKPQAAVWVVLFAISAGWLGRLLGRLWSDRPAGPIDIKATVPTAVP